MISASDSCKPLTPKQVRKNQHLVEDAVRYAPYAIFSNNAYLRGEKAIPLPESWVEVKIPDVRTDIPKQGFGLAVFERRIDGELSEVVVAFRGTDSLKDWIHNLVPFFRIQMPTAEGEFVKVLEYYKGQSIKIVATGHSLGGGLAYHMSFIHPSVDAIAFNSSPVTKAGLNPLRTNTQVSVWESGEILQMFRNSVNWTRNRWVQTQRVEFRFLHGLPIKQHSIRRLALNLVKLGSLSSEQLSAQSLKAVIEMDCERQKT